MNDAGEKRQVIADTSCSVGVQEGRGTTPESPSLSSMELLMERGAHVDSADPYIRRRGDADLHFNKTRARRGDPEDLRLRLIATDHSTSITRSSRAIRRSLWTRGTRPQPRRAAPSKKQAVIVKA